MNKKIGIFGLAVLTVLALTAGTAMAATTTKSAKVKAANQTGNEVRQRPAELTDAQKVEMEARRSEMKTKMTAVQTAIAAGDYDAWVIAQTALDENCPLLTKITKDNFGRYLESVKLRQQAEAIDQELGIQPGFGHPGGFGHGQGQLKINKS